MDPKKRVILMAVGLILAAVILLLVINSRRGGELFSPGDPDGLSFTCGEQLSYNGKEYSTVEIGNSCWMAENLRTTEYRDGSPISNFITGAEWSVDQEGSYACYLNFPENCTAHGALYNWYAVVNEAGLCPAGWTVPSNNHWASLERAVCNELGYSGCDEKFPFNGIMDWKGTDEGSHLKSENVGGLDTYGFNAEFAGFRNPNGPFTLLEERGFWWTTSSSNEFAQGRMMNDANDGIRRIESMKSSGFSVRCVQE